MKNLKSLTIIFLVLAFLGFADATYLTVEHYLGVIPPCTAALNGCETVLTSQWSQIGGMPIALLGALNYLLLGILAILTLRSDSRKFILSASYLSFIGFAISAFLLYIQLSVLKHICIYCTVSAGISIVIFLVGLTVIANSKGSDYECDSVFHPCIRAKNNFIVKV